MNKQKVHVRFVPESLKGGVWNYKSMCFPARILAVAEGYAMARRKGASPNCYSVKELFDFPIVAKPTTQEKGRG